MANTLPTSQAITVEVMRVTHLTMINYCYLVRNPADNNAVLIDPAWEPEKIEEAVALHHATLAGILITHHHFDHVHLSAALAIKYNVPVYMSQVEIDYYQFQCPHLIPIDIFSPFCLSTIHVQPLLTPGHTKGATCYLIGNKLFTGDTLFIEGCGLCRTPEDAAAMFDSLTMLKKSIPPTTIIYPGHSYGIPVGQPFAFVMEKNIYLMIDKKDDFVTYRMRDNQRNLFDFK